MDKWIAFLLILVILSNLDNLIKTLLPLIRYLVDNHALELVIASRCALILFTLKAMNLIGGWVVEDVEQVKNLWNDPAESDTDSFVQP